MVYVLFDIGGTNTRVTVSGDLQSFEEPIKFKTPVEFVDGVEAICHAVEKLVGDKKISAVAGGIRGPLDEGKTTIVSDVVLCDWVCKPIVEILEKRLGTTVYLENDSSMAALGEANFGAGKGYEIVAYHTVSTGVGGARVIEGMLDEANTNFEPGYQILDVDGSVLESSEPNILQDLISGTALEKRRGVKPYEVSQDDPVWDELAKYLAAGLKNTIVYWSPDVIVLGGSMILGDPRILLGDIIEHTREVLDEEQECPPIVDGQFRDDGGLYGAMALLKQKV